MNEILEKLFGAADNHGEDSGEPDHTVGDLQDMVRRAWAIMSVGQKLQFLLKPGLDGLVEAGARDEFTVDSLVASIAQKIGEMETEVAAAGYRMMEGEGGFFWETDEDASEDFCEREDAVADAHSHLSFGASLPQGPSARM